MSHYAQEKRWLISFTIPHDEENFNTKEKVVDWLDAQLGSQIRQSVAVVGPVNPAKQDKD